MRHKPRTRKAPAVPRRRSGRPCQTYCNRCAWDTRIRCRFLQRGRVGKKLVNRCAHERSLRFHIASLRKALGGGKGGARYITTLAGRGYCFVAPISRSSNQVQVEAFVASTAGARAVRGGLGYCRSDACWRPWASLACSSGSGRCADQAAFAALKCACAGSACAGRPTISA
jgi:hypothetical protein